jgi:formylglycine-generating enzyme required for sulfatase activity
VIDQGEKPDSPPQDLGKTAWFEPSVMAHVAVVEQVEKPDSPPQAINNTAWFKPETVSKVSVQEPEDHRRTLHQATGETAWFKPETVSKVSVQEPEDPKDRNRAANVEINPTHTIVMEKDSIEAGMREMRISLENQNHEPKQEQSKADQVESELFDDVLPTPLWQSPIVWLIGLIVLLLGLSGAMLWHISSSKNTDELRSLGGVGSKDKAIHEIEPNKAVLQINSDPSGAALWFNGRDTGITTPVSLNLKPARYSLELRLAGYRSVTRQFELKVGQNFALDVTLSPESVEQKSSVGQRFPSDARPISKHRIESNAKMNRQKQFAELSIRTTPSGATIIINDRKITAHTPHTIKMPTGRYRIQISMLGYISHTRDLNLKAEVHEKLNVVLKPQITNTLDISISSEPSGASIEINDRDTGQKTPATIALPVGHNHISLSLDGYQTWKKAFDIQPKTQPQISAKLKRSGPVGMVFIAGGSFWMGNNAGVYNEKPMRRVKLSAYWIDRYEVSVGDYLQCVKAEHCKPAGKKHGCNGHHADRLNHPINCVNWFDARRYCAWKGKRLPTEAQWEKAARGKTPQLYPWGHDSPSCNLANYRSCQIGGTTPVGSKAKGRSPYGLYDMAGNVWEWLRDRFDPQFYQKGPVQDPFSKSGAQTRVIRGGSWDDPPDRIHSTFRADFWPYNRANTVGFRCVK